jgi:hypothetical protein
VLYLGLGLDPAYAEGSVEGALEQTGEDDPDGENFLRGIWEEGDDRHFDLHGPLLCLLEWLPVLL